MNTLRKAFLDKYPKYEIVLRMFEEANGVECTFTNLSKLRLRNFVNFMEGRIARSSARQYAAKFKAVLNLYSEEVNLPSDYAKILTVRNEKCVSVWLTEDELEKIAKYEPKTENERLVRAQFLIGAYSGCRKSDFCRITKENISNGYLSYVSQKTKTQANVPLKPIVAELVKKVPVGKELSEPTFNNILREICYQCGITDSVKVFRAGVEEKGEKWRFVTSHTARKSFCTNLYLRGADLYSISKMAGHSSVEMTATNYIVCGLREQSAKVLEYFK